MQPSKILLLVFTETFSESINFRNSDCSKRNLGTVAAIDVNADSHEEDLWLPNSHTDHQVPSQFLSERNE